MKDDRAAMLKSLIAIAWADQTLHDREMEVIEALFARFELSAEEAHAMREYARTPRSLGEVPMSPLSSDDSRLLLCSAVLVSYADGHLDPAELRIIDDLVGRLRIPAAEAAPLLAAAHGRARRLAPARADRA